MRMRVSSLKMGTHSMRIVLGRCNGSHGSPRDQHWFQRCMHGVFHHLVLEGPAMQFVWDRYPALFSPAKNTMQFCSLFIKQHDTVGVEHHRMHCSGVLVPCHMLLVMHVSQQDAFWGL